MSRSAIARLDGEVKEELDRLIRSGRATISELHDYLAERLGDEAPSRAAVGRYTKNVNDAMAQFREAQTLAQTWAEKIPENGDVAQLTRQILTTLAFKVAGDLSARDEVEADDVAKLGRALQHIATSEDAQAKARQRALQERRQALEASISQAEQQAGPKPLTVADFRQLVANVYGA